MSVFAHVGLSHVNCYFQVVPWDFTDYGRRGFALFGKAMTADGGETMLDLL